MLHLKDLHCTKIVQDVFFTVPETGTPSPLWSL